MRSETSRNIFFVSIGVVVLLLIFEVGSKVFFNDFESELEVPRNADTARYGGNLTSPTFEIPTLLTMTQGEIREHLGMPTTEFSPNQQQIGFGMVASYEYRRGSTTLQIDFGSDGSVSEMFLSDNTAGRPAAELFQLGGLSQSSSSYNTRVREWINPALARRNGESEVAGIIVTR